MGCDAITALTPWCLKAYCHCGISIGNAKPKEKWNARGYCSRCSVSEKTTSPKKNSWEMITEKARQWLELEVSASVGKLENLAKRIVKA